MTEKEYREKAKILIESDDLSVEIRDEALIKLNQLYMQNPQPVDYKPMESVKNFLPNLGDELKGFASMLASPVETAKSMGNLAISGVNNLGQGVENMLPESVLSNINRATNALGLPERSITDPRNDRVKGQELGEAAFQSLANDYGSMDAIKTTAMERPAGMLLDLAGLLAGGGTALAKTGGKLGSVGEKIAETGAMIDPITGLIKAPVAAIEGVLGEPLSAKLYGSSFKPTTTILPNVREKLIQDGLNLKAMPTPRSTKKIEKQRKKVQQQREKVLNESENLGRIIEEGQLYTKVDDVRKNYAPPKPSSVYAPKIIDDVLEEVSEGFYLNGGRRLTIPELDAIKKDIDKTINFNRINKSGDSKATRGDIDEEARLAVANAARELIYKHAPDLEPLNRQYGSIRNVQNNLQHQGTARNQNNSPIGLLQTTATSAGGPVGGLIATADKAVPKAFLGIKTNEAGKVVRSPLTTAILATANIHEQAVLIDEEERRRERELKEAQREDRR